MDELDATVEKSKRRISTCKMQAENFESTKDLYRMTHETILLLHRGGWRVGWLVMGDGGRCGSGMVDYIRDRQRVLRDAKFVLGNGGSTSNGFVIPSILSLRF
jgi:hypothetical protein